MEEKKLIEKITNKKELSQLPEKDVKMALEKFAKRQTSDEEKVRLTRELLHKVFSSFTSQKLLSPKNKPADWILRKHISTRERLPYYKEIYSRIFKKFKGKVSVIDLGAGINGFSYNFFANAGISAYYVGIEAVGQLVSLTNDYFTRQNLSGKAMHLSLFEIDKMKKLIKSTNQPRVIFLFKTLDSLEMMERNYSFKLIKEILPLSDLIVVSFATRSMIKARKFKANRNWITDFIEENYNIKDLFEIGGEKYICFAKE